jgi:2-polyprenyl-3-methyl-5-hydroxy-6-metoxy-1,4-benzoquinol methylase
MADWGLDVTGMDFSPFVIERARRLHGAAKHLTFRVHDFNADSIRTFLHRGSVDIVVCRLSLPFLDRERFLVDVKRWLVPQGVLHITTAVHERTPPKHRHRGLTQSEIEVLKQEWSSATRYDLENDGSITCLVLRGPH